MSPSQTTLALRAVCVGLGALACNALLGIDEASLACPAGANCSPSEPMEIIAPVAAAQAVETALPTTDAGPEPLSSEDVPNDSIQADAGSTGTPAPPALTPDTTTRVVPLPALCAAGQVSCDGARLVVCTADGSGFAVLDECANAARCDAEAAACAPAACEPDERRCQGPALQSCNAEGTGFVLEQQCASAALCSTEGCAPPLCSADQRRCQGAQLESCNAERSGFVPEQQCASAALCSPAGCQSAACAANERRCQGAQLERCNADRTGFEPEQQCASAALCSGAGCQPPPTQPPPTQPPPTQPPPTQPPPTQPPPTQPPPTQPPPTQPPPTQPPPPTPICIPGARRCSSAGTVAVCAASGLTESTSACPVLQACSNGACSLLGLSL